MARMAHPVPTLTGGGLQDNQFIRNGFFRYANSAMLEFLNLKPDTADGLQLLRVDRTLTPNTPQPGYTLNLDEQGQPKLVWNKDAFDEKGNVLMPMYRFPHNDNCMMCHLASSGVNRISSKGAPGSRRGFYGFGTDSVETLNPDGTRVADFKDDVHKGKVWLDDTGESREIQSCNACHSKEYYKPASTPIELSPDHQFLKGNTDSDVRRDLTNTPKPAECDYCHNTAKSPSLPSSGQHTALDAHRELWKQRGYMEGYMPATYDKVVQVHFDQITCQTCHINNVAYNDKPGAIHYRNRIDHDGRMKVIPYKPHTRFYSQDKTSGRILSRYETQSVLVKKMDAGGVAYGAIVDPDTQQEIGKVSINSMGQLGEPETYDDYRHLKQLYDKLLAKKGYGNPDVKFIYTETNEYMLNHQTRPAKEAVPCADCHEKDSRGYRAAVSDSGLFGRDKRLSVGKIPDRRLVNEGIFILGKPYYQIDDSGNITENVADVLEASAINPSMSILNAENVRETSGYLKSADYATGSEYLRITPASAEKLSSLLNSSQWLVFSSETGYSGLKRAALLMPGTAEQEARLRTVRVSLKSRPSNKADLQCASGLGAREIKDIYTLSFQNPARKNVVNLPGKGDILIKLPYTGSLTSADQVTVAYSSSCKSWQKLSAGKIVDFAPVTADGAGYIVIRPTAPEFARVKNLAILE